MAIKLDINKAYKCVVWNYLKQMLKVFGFHEKWVSWVMACVASVSYSINTNGHKTGFFKLSRGIRQ